MIILPLLFHQSLSEMNLCWVLLCFVCIWDVGFVMPGQGFGCKLGLKASLAKHPTRFSWNFRSKWAFDLLLSFSGFSFWRVHFYSINFDVNWPINGPCNFSSYFIAWVKNHASYLNYCQLLRVVYVYNCTCLFLLHSNSPQTFHPPSLQLASCPVIAPRA